MKAKPPPVMEMKVTFFNEEEGKQQGVWAMKLQNNWYCILGQTKPGIGEYSVWSPSKGYKTPFKFVKVKGQEMGRESGEHTADLKLNISAPPIVTLPAARQSKTSGDFPTSRLDHINQRQCLKMSSSTDAPPSEILKAHQIIGRPGHEWQQIIRERLRRNRVNYDTDVVVKLSFPGGISGYCAYCHFRKDNERICVSKILPQPLRITDNLYAFVLFIDAEHMCLISQPDQYGYLHFLRQDGKYSEQLAVRVQMPIYATEATLKLPPSGPSYANITEHTPYTISSQVDDDVKVGAQQHHEASHVTSQRNTSGKGVLSLAANQFEDIGADSVFSADEPTASRAETIFSFPATPRSSSTHSFQQKEPRNPSSWTPTQTQRICSNASYNDSASPAQGFSARCINPAARSNGDDTESGRSRKRPRSESQYSALPLDQLADIIEEKRGHLAYIEEKMQKITEEEMHMRRKYLFTIRNLDDEIADKEQLMRRLGD
ncbi:hypothetical protein NA57DRAFT_76351 [Rhizodiscina lignyota]|uniref:Uncharacterized protein n=1 Tax=Rhizodiscina lignyota TaxID=1504668 RepID=A0A9P4M6D0_9PEZI|nr:hypothetical protein NA57DRAFT_76351 [Rhizodiscina lignyota]